MIREPSLPQTLTRRDFLKTSTVAASAAAIGTLDLSRSAHAAGSDIIKVGMIGCGGRNAGAADQALTADPGARLVAMCDILRDRIEDKLGALKAAKGAQVTVDEAHRFTGFDAYKHVIEASDVVLIANAAKFHPFHAMAAIQAGKHVFVEKPHGADPRGRQADAASLRPGQGEEALHRVGPAKPFPHGLYRDGQAHSGRRHRRQS